MLNDPAAQGQTQPGPTPVGSPRTSFENPENCFTVLFANPQSIVLDPHMGPTGTDGAPPDPNDNRILPPEFYGVLNQVLEKGLQVGEPPSTRGNGDTMMVAAEATTSPRRFAKAWAQAAWQSTTWGSFCPCPARA